MSPLVLREDAALYALGAVTPGERAAFERMIARDPTLARVVADYARTAALLAWAAPAASPPPDLRERILDGLPAHR